MTTQADDERRGGSHTPPPFDPALLDILVCPLTHGPLEWDPERSELVSRKARLAYPVRDGVPIMLVDEARRLDEEA